MDDVTALLIQTCISVALPLFVFSKVLVEEIIQHLKQNKINLWFWENVSLMDFLIDWKLFPDFHSFIHHSFTQQTFFVCFFWYQGLSSERGLSSQKVITNLTGHPGAQLLIFQVLFFSWNRRSSHTTTHSSTPYPLSAILSSLPKVTSTSSKAQIFTLVHLKYISLHISATDSEQDNAVK